MRGKPGSKRGIVLKQAIKSIEKRRISRTSRANGGSASLAAASSEAESKAPAVFANNCHYFHVSDGLPSVVGIAFFRPFSRRLHTSSPSHGRLIHPCLAQNDIHA